MFKSAQYGAVISHSLDLMKENFVLCSFDEMVRPRDLGSCTDTSLSDVTWIDWKKKRSSVSLQKPNCTPRTGSDSRNVALTVRPESDHTISAR